MSNITKITENLIVGSGVSSLSYAQQYRQNKKDFIILEKEGFGGKAQTYQDPSKRFRFDIGGHLFHCLGQSQVNISGVNIKGLNILKRNAKVYLQGAIHNHPIQKNKKALNLHSEQKILGSLPLTH